MQTPSKMLMESINKFDIFNVVGIKYDRTTPRPKNSKKKKNYKGKYLRNPQTVLIRQKCWERLLSAPVYSLRASDLGIYQITSCGALSKGFSKSGKDARVFCSVLHSKKMDCIGDRHFFTNPHWFDVDSDDHMLLPYTAITYGYQKGKRILTLTIVYSHFLANTYFRKRDGTYHVWDWKDEIASGLLDSSSQRS